MPRPERCYKTTLHSSTIHKVSGAAVLPGPDVTGPQDQICPQVHITTGSSLRLFRNHVQSGDASFVYCHT